MREPSRQPVSLTRPTLMVLVVLVLVACLAVTALDRIVPVADGVSDPGLVTPAKVVDLLPLQSSGRRIVDTAGRDVLLRGANVNSLGEYWQGVPAIAPTVPLTSAAWDEMAAHGFSVVRLLITWSRVEPTRGMIDQSYLDEVDAAVTEAAAHGIYTVIDMHQDAYTAFISTTDPAACPPGTTPAKGWDGAPAWAVLTEGASTCLAGSDRNSSPAVVNAWNNFYDNVDGIRTEFVHAWSAVATRFAGRPEVAGYDLLNEPETSRPAVDLQAPYDELLVDTIEAIRTVEEAAPFGHLIFIQPTVPAGNLANGIVIPDPSGLTDRSNLVAAPHNYGESITAGVTIEQMNNLFDAVGASLDVPQWTGEYGSWDTTPETLARIRRYAADEDARAWGGAWWQWRQSCGDPHSVQWQGSEVVQPTGTETHLNLLGCPGNVDLGANNEFLEVLGRGYPRATPGHIDQLRSDPDTGEMTLSATATVAGGELVVWTPTTDGPEHRVVTTNLVDVEQHAVAGGRIVTAKVAAAGAYEFSIEPVSEPPTTSSVPPTTSSVPPTTSSVPTNAPVKSVPSSMNPSGVSTAQPAKSVSGQPAYAG